MKDSDIITTKEAVDILNKQGYFKPRKVGSCGSIAIQQLTFRRELMKKKNKEPIKYKYEIVFKTSRRAIKSYRTTVFAISISSALINLLNARQKQDKGKTVVLSIIEVPYYQYDIGV